MRPALSYPPSRRDEVVDDYHGTPVADPYRWLEDAERPDTRAWVDAQNALTRRMLDGRERDRLLERLRLAYDYPRCGVPLARGGRYFYTRNSGLQNQAVLLVQEGLEAPPRSLLDPNTLSADGTVALTAWAPREDGALVAYALSDRGSDWQRIAIRDVATGADLTDDVRWAKFTNLSWMKDGSGFFYTRFPAPGTVPAGDEHYYSRVCFHRLGESQDRDRLVLERPGEPEVVFSTMVTHDGRYLVISAFKGASDASEVFTLDLRDPDAVPAPLFTGFTATFVPADTLDGEIVFRTTDGAPLGRVIAVDPETCGPPGGDARGSQVRFREVVPPTEDTLTAVHVVGSLLAVKYLHHASDRVMLFDRDGRPASEIPLPMTGSVPGIEGQPGSNDLFFGFTSYVYQPSVFRTDLATFAVAPFGDHGTTVDPADYEMTEVWYESRDGTRVSMFLAHRRDLPRDGNRLVYLTGYGGFNVSVTPAFDPAFLPWFEAGGVLAVAHLRGGGEYGEEWHRAGMRRQKQRVFDDFIAAAEWLIASGYTRPERLAIEGGSNGGLLVGAVAVQRPDLFGAAICRVPVLDMLRYHRFTVGRFWIPEYGSADDPVDFEYLFRYSPLHNVQDGVAYPSMLITTADTDDRVAPGMAKKFAARMQAATRGSGPILIRVETRAGHGAGKPITKQIEERADILAFLFRFLT